MNILGICNANNSGAALIVDGKVIAAVNEERFIRVKQTRDFPENAIRSFLKGNVDILVIGDFVVTSSKQNNF